MNKLIGMTDFVKDIEDYVHENESIKRGFKMITSYAELLQVNLSLSFFIPCDERGKPIEKPEHIECENPHYIFRGQKGQDVLDFPEYKAALKKVLFKGFVLEPAKNKASHGRLLSLNGRNVAGYNDINMALEFIDNPTTIEGLIGTDIELIPTQACVDIIR